jgi:DNA-binding SARP family transcriptional activator
MLPSSVLRLPSNSMLMLDHPSQLTIRLLGTPIVERDGVPWSLTNQKAQALFFYLATTGQVFTRDYLAALLWGDAAVRNARHSLRSSLYKLREALRDCESSDVLLIEDERVQLDLRRVSCDVAHFRQCIAKRSELSLREAVALVRGPFVQGFGVPDAAIFDEFVQLEDARLTRSCLGALDQLATLAEQRAEWEPAIAYVRRIIQLDPLAEQAQQRLMALYVRSGSPGLARRHYQHFERTLRQELGIAPAPQTQEALLVALEQQRVDQQHTVRSTAFAPLTSLRLPFVGRDALLVQLQDIAQAAAAGRGATVLLQGTAGIGKSRLVDELLAALAAGSYADRHWTLLQGRCSPFDSILAYGAFRDAFHHLLPDRFDQTHDPQQPASAVDLFAQRVLLTLDAGSRSAPVVLAIDDLHLADRLTLDLFGYLALHLRDRPVLLIGTVQRVDDVPALQALTSLGRRHDELTLLTLPPLTVAAVAGLLAGLGVVATAVESLAPWLCARAAGNPFVVAAIIAQLRAEAILAPHDRDWHLDSQRWLGWRATALLPETTHDLVMLRLNALQPAARSILNVLAVAGDRLTPALIAATLDADISAIQATLDELLALQLVAEQGDAITLPHHLLRETLLHHLSGLTKRALHGRLAAAWEHTTASNAAAAEQIARHAVASGDIPRARRYGLNLLSELPYSYAGATTISFLQQLHDLVAATASLDEQRRLAHALGQAHRSLGQLDLAASWHWRQLALAQRAEAPDAEAIAHFELAELAFVTNNYVAAADSARAGIDRSAHAAEGLRLALRGRGQRLLGGALAMEGSDLPGAEQHLQAAIAAHRQADDRINLGAALFELGNVIAQQGAIDRALDRYREAAEVVDGDGAPFLLALAHNNIAYHCLLLGQPDDARRAAARGRALAEQHSLSGALLHLYSTESEIHLYAGDWAAASAACQHGLALAEDLGNIERQAGYRAGLALVAAGAGQTQAALDMFEAALGLIAGRGFWHLRTRLLLGLAELLLDANPAAVGMYLDTALILARTQNRRLLALHGERLQALLLAATGDAATAQARLVGLLDRAAELGLSLEVARTRAALARVTLQQAPMSESGRALLDEALRALETHGARAEHAALSAMTNSHKTRVR